MSRTPTSQDEIRKRLKEAVDVLRKDATRVEIWATALAGFAEPVPAYEPDDKFRLPPQRHTLPKETKNGRR